MDWPTFFLCYQIDSRTIGIVQKNQSSLGNGLHMKYIMTQNKSRKLTYEIFSKTQPINKLTKIFLKYFTPCTFNPKGGKS